MAFAGHVLRGSSGSDALQILEGKLENKSAHERRMWLDDIKTWTNLDAYEAIKRTAEDRHLWISCTRAACLYLLMQKKTADNNDDIQNSRLLVLVTFRK